MSEGTVDITTLGLALDSTALVDGASVMDSFVSKAEEAADAADRFSESSERMAAADRSAAQEGSNYVEQVARKVAALEEAQQATSALVTQAAMLEDPIALVLDFASLVEAEEHLKSLTGALAATDSLIKLFASELDNVDGAKLIEAANSMQRLSADTATAAQEMQRLSAEESIDPTKVAAAAEEMRRLATDAFDSAQAVIALASADDGVESTRIREAAEAVRQYALDSLAAADAMQAVALANGAIEPGKMREVAEETQDAAEAAKAMTIAERDLIQAKMEENAAIIKANDARAKEEAAIQAAAAALTKEEEAGDRFVEGLTKQVIALDQNRDALLRLEIARRDLTDAQRADALHMADQLKAHADGVEATKRTTEANREFQGVLESVGIHLPKLSFGLLGAATAFAAVAAAAKQAVETFIPAQAIQIRMEETFRIMGTSAKMSAHEVEEFAMKVQKNTTFTDEAVKEGATQLAKFANLTSDQFKQALEVSVNLAAVMKTDVAGAANLVGRALETSYGTMMLRRAGLMTEAQVSVAKALKELGRDAEATNYTLGVLQEKTGNAAEAFSQGLGGALTQLHNRLEEDKEVMGGWIVRFGKVEEAVRGVTAILNWLSDWKMPKFEFPEVKLPDWMEKVWFILKSAGQLSGALMNPASFIKGGASVVAGIGQREMEQNAGPQTPKDWVSPAQAAEDKRRAEELKNTIKLRDDLDKVLGKNKSAADRVADAEFRLDQEWAKGTPEIRERIMALGGLDAAKKKLVDFEMKDFDKKKPEDLSGLWAKERDEQLATIAQAAQARKSDMDAQIQDIQFLQQMRLISEQETIDRVSVLRQTENAKRQEDNRKAIEIEMEYVDRLMVSRTPQNAKQVDKKLEEEQLRLNKLYADGNELRKQGDDLIVSQAQSTALLADRTARALEEQQRGFAALLESYDKANDAIEHQVEAPGMTEEQQVRFNAEYAVTMRLLADGERLVSQWRKAVASGNQELIDDAVNAMNVFGEQWEGRKKIAVEATVLLYENTKALNEQKQVWSELYGITANFFVDLFNNGTKAFKNLWEKFKQIAFQILAEVAAKKVVVSILGAFGMAGGGLAEAATQGSGGIVGAAANAIGGGNPLSSLTSPTGILNKLGAFGGSGAAVQGGLPLTEYALGGAGEALTGSLGSSLMAAAPYAAIAAIVLPSILKMFKKPPKEGGFGSSGDVGDTQRFFKQTQYDAALTDATKAMVTNYDQMLALLGGTGTAGFAQGVQGRKGKNKDATTTAFVDGQEVYRAAGVAVGKDEASIQAGLELESKRALLAALQASNLPEEIANILNSVSAVGASADAVDRILSVAQAFGTVSKMIENLDPTKLVDMLDKTQAQNAMDTWREQGNALDKLVENFDGSVAATENLTNASIEYYNSTIGLVAQIHEVSASIDSMFANTREQIFLTGRTNEFEYNYWRELADKKAEAIKTMTDPTQIAQAEQDINQMIGRAFGLLDEGSQERLRDEFLKGIDEANKIGQDRLAELGDTVTGAATSDLQSVKDLLSEIAKQMNGAAEKNVTAADKNLEAANTPVKVTVDVQLDDRRIPDGNTG